MMHFFCDGRSLYLPGCIISKSCDSRMLNYEPAPICALAINNYSTLCKVYRPLMGDKCSTWKLKFVIKIPLI